MRSVALTFRPLIFQKGKLRHRQTWQTCNGSHCMSVLEPGKELMNTAVNFLVLFLPRLGGMFTPCSLSSRLTGSLRISPGLPAPLPPFPPARSTYFPRVFRLLLQWCWGPAKRQPLSGKRGLPFPNQTNGRRKTEKKKKSPSTRRYAQNPFPLGNLGAFSSSSCKLQEAQC